MGITKSFNGVTVLRGIDAHVASGEVLALLGENGAGKSTLVKIISGEYTADSGRVTLGGELLDRLTPAQAQRLGIAVIAQEIQDAPDLTVAENIFLGSPPTSRGVVSWRRMRAEARELLARLEIDLDVDAEVRSLTIGQRQVIEIARALTRKARVLILDEPSAALSQQEVGVLFAWVRRLRSQGVAIIYITHRLDEVAVLADRVQVMRDGSTVLDQPTRQVTRDQMVEAMIGRAVAEISHARSSRVSRGDEVREPVLQMVSLSDGERFADVDLALRPGEIACLYGRLGSGAEEVAEACFGIRRPRSGQTLWHGHQMIIRGPRQAVARGIALLPADRKASAAFLNLSVAENVSSASWASLARWRTFVTRGDETRVYDKWKARLGIRATGGAQQAIARLSGGNQQKVLLARWLQREASLVVLIEPTRGVDVGARHDIYKSIQELASDGVAVLVSTSDYEEVVQIADVAHVMVEGRIVISLTGADISEEKLLSYAGGAL